jgi:hypothetical protein
MVVIPFPESKADSSAGITPTSQTSASMLRSLEVSTPPLPSKPQATTAPLVRHGHRRAASHPESQI